MMPANLFSAPKAAFPICVWAIVFATCWSSESAAQEKTKFYDPIEKTIAGWTVLVEPRLLEQENADVADKAFEALANHLQRIKYIVPKDRLARLMKLRIWLELDNPVLGNMQYHPARGWL
ncbi:MAG: hypothetical protein CMJ48_06185, partial [Planctomycetaceae bacterium]|nr:hypothetical protein [Planctomycetaceae bacterium]